MKLVILITALLLSAFFSGSETAFVSASRIKLEILLKRRMKGAKLAYDFAMKPERFLTTTLVGTNIMLVTFSSLIAFYLEGYFSEWTILVITSFFLLIFGEIVPKTIFRELAHTLILRISLPLRIFYFVFYPLIGICSQFSMALLRLWKVNKRELAIFFSKKDLEILIREGERDGVVEREEREIISKLFRLSHQRVKEVMVPRTEIAAVNRDDSIDAVASTFQQTGYSRLVVMDEDVDHIVGFVHARDLFEKPEKLEQIIREIMFVPETKKSIELLKEFRIAKATIAIAVDEYGGTAGLVTIEDIIEKIFGEIKDEYDYEQRLYEVQKDGSLIVSARAEVEEINEKFRFNLPTGDYETIGGLCIDRTGRIPKENEVIDLGHCRITILKASVKKVEVVKIEKIQFFVKNP